MKEIESQLSARGPATVPARADVSRPDDATLRLVRQLVAESEQRQASVLARQILQVSRDAQSARQADYDRLVYVIQKLQGTSAETSVRQRAIEDHLARVAFQR
jgi:hypothetical protein